MSKKVVLVGHCGPDSSFLRMAVSSTQKGLAVVSADDEQALRKAIEQGADLLLVNRVLDYGFEEESGAEVIRRLRAQHPGLKMMLVSNYAEAQAEAVAAGALPGFGKRELGSLRVAEMLREALGME
jgi:two-component system chemotaxis response regulator CheY